MPSGVIASTTYSNMSFEQFNSYSSQIKHVQVCTRVSGVVRLVEEAD